MQPTTISIPTVGISETATCGALATDVPPPPGGGGGGGGEEGTPFSGSIEYTIPGTYTWDPPLGITSPITVSGVGNGGAGGGATTLNSPKGAGGGGAGENVANQLLPVVYGTPVTIVIPAAAAAVTGADGNDGANVTVNSTAIILHGGKGGKASGVGGQGGGVGGAGGNFNTPTGDPGISGAPESATFSTGSGGGGAGSTGTANGGPGGSAGSNAGGPGGSAASGGAGGGGGGSTIYGVGASGANGRGTGFAGTGNGPIRLVQYNASSGYAWSNATVGDSPQITLWTYPPAAIPIRIRRLYTNIVNLYDNTTLSLIGTDTPILPAEDYPSKVTIVEPVLANATWASGGYHVKTDGTKIPLLTNTRYQIGSTTTNPALVGGTVTGIGGSYIATTNFGAAAGIPASEWIGGLVNSTDNKETYVFTAPTFTYAATLVINKWYKIVNAVVVAQGTVSPTLGHAEPCFNNHVAPYENQPAPENTAACFENNSPYCWVAYGASVGRVSLYSINAAGNFGLDPIGGSLSSLWGGGYTRPGIISPALGYAVVAGFNTLLTVTRWAPGSEGGVFGIGGGGGGGGTNTSGGIGGTGRIKLEWTGITPA